jgi:hypothetical protein
MILDIIFIIGHNYAEKNQHKCKDLRYTELKFKLKLLSPSSTAQFSFGSLCEMENDPLNIVRNSF